jgi:aminoglycoside phosphotransferase family enzyme/predicted kinase
MSAESLPPLIQALLDPARYPHPVERVEVVQTHGAWVLLAGAFAYKIKKPVQLPFMDFHTLALRRAACEAEIRVNRRLEPLNADVPRLYLQALPITGSAQNPRWGTPGTPDEAQAIEYAVQMHRFTQSGRLDHLCESGALSREHVGALAQRIAAFQSSAAVASAQSAWGRPADVLVWTRDNFPPLRECLSESGWQDTLAQLSDWTETRHAQLVPLLEQRRQQGFVREGHGDLHLANLTLINGVVVPFDAIEFNDALRWIDTASELAFTWMDLLAQQQPGLANLLLCDWLDATGDVQAPQLLPFFAVYRALVRAKVVAIRSTQDGADRQAALAQAATYVALAQRIACPPAPQLLITHGLSGSGKTWASTRWLLAEASGRALRLRSDVERKRLHGLSAQQASGSGLNTGLYSPQAHTDTYAHLLARTQALLSHGWTVVVDAAFLRRHERSAFAALARRLGCPFHILAPEAPVDVLRLRISARQAQGTDASEATLAVLEQQLSWLEPLDEAERQRVL